MSHLSNGKTRIHNLLSVDPTTLQLPQVIMVMRDSEGMALSFLVFSQTDARRLLELHELSFSIGNPTAETLPETSDREMIELAGDYPALFTHLYAHQTRYPVGYIEVKWNVYPASIPLLLAPTKPDEIYGLIGTIDREHRVSVSLFPSKSSAMSAMLELILSLEKDDPADRIQAESDFKSHAPYIKKSTAPDHSHLETVELDPGLSKWLIIWHTWYLNDTGNTI